MVEYWVDVKVVDSFTIFTAINSFPLKISYNKKGVVARFVGLLWLDNSVDTCHKQKVFLAGQL